MPRDAKLEDDDYVAKLLAEDAKKSSQRYASHGLSALLPKRSTKAAPKPNTRFLNQIVRQADSHNAALKKKEELESRIRLKQMREREEGREREQDGDGRERKRRRTETDDDHRIHRRKRSRDRRRSRSPHESKGKGDQERDIKPHKRSKDKEHHSTTHRHRSDDQDRKSKHHSKSKSTRTEPKRETKPSNNDKHRSKRHKSPSSESDPLEDLVGPLPSNPEPTVQIRGRGAHNPHKSNIDTHFSSTYDPSLDIHPDLEAASDHEDWDMALEALRDRAMWKKKQGNRMREAGFGDEEIRKWESGAVRSGREGGGGDGGGDGDVGDVRWVKKGEAREWDLGKKGFDDD